MEKETGGRVYDIGTSEEDRRFAAPAANNATSTAGIARRMGSRDCSSRPTRDRDESKFEGRDLQRQGDFIAKSGVGEAPDLSYRGV